MDQEEHDLTQSPGNILRVARQARSLSQVDIAGKLRVSVQTIKEIENDDYSHSTALIYTRGYLRMYAREIGLSEDMILQSFGRLDVITQVNDPVSLQSSPVLESPSQQKYRLFRWISWCIALLLVLLIVMWWHGQRHVDSASLQPSQVKPLVVSTTIQPTQNGVRKVASVTNKQKNQLRSASSNFQVSRVKKS